MFSFSLVCYVAICACIRSAELQSSKSHISTSRCENICVMPPKCSRKERRRGFSNRSSVDAVMSGRRCVFLCESKNALFGLPKVDAIRNLWLIFVYYRKHNPNVRICATHFMDDCFVNLGEYKAGCAQRLFLKKNRVNSDFAMTIWHFWISDCKYVLLLFKVFAIDCSNAELCIV